MGVLGDDLPFPVVLMPGYGLDLKPPGWWRGRDQEELFGRLLIWEAPSPKAIYVLSCDVADGIGEDRSCIDITKLGSLHEGEVQVAQFISPYIDPVDLAHVVDVMGRLYAGNDGMSAVAAIEINNHGIATQSELVQHIGYDNIYVWQYEDMRPDKDPRTTKLGFSTNKSTRPIMLVRYVKKIKGIDEVTGMPDYRINSPFTIQELRTFRTLETLTEAEADPTNPDAHDDAIMAGAIGIYVCHRLQMEGGETYSDKRKRLSEQQRREEILSQAHGQRLDFRNGEYTDQEMRAGALFEEEEF